MVTDTEEITVRSIVSQVVERVHDPDKAVKQIIERLRSSPPEQEAWNSETARMAVRDMVHQQRHLNRATAVRASWLNPQSANAVEERVVRSMLDEYTIGSKALGDCTRPDLVYAGATARNQEIGFRVKRLFLEKLTAELPDDETKVRAVLNDERTVKIHREAERAAAKAVRS